jgi:hypothetical protein
MIVDNRVLKSALLLAALGGSLPLHAAEAPKSSANIEDLPIDPGGAPGAAQPVAPTNAPTANSEMIMVPRAVWEKLLRDVEELKGKGSVPSTSPSTLPSTAPATTPSTTVPLETEPSKTGAQPSSTGSRNYLLLPDISLVLQGKGLLSSDKRDDERNKAQLSEAELSIQGYVYPGVKADAFIVGAPGEDEPFGLEEGFLTFQNLGKGLSLNAGKKFVPFGRTGEQHNHSWQYPRQLLPIRNLVAEEALIGQGVNLHYVLPTKGKLFARASLGIFNGEGTETQVNVTDPTDPFFGGVPSGSGAGFYDRFYNARLWLGHPFGKNGELDGGFSYAQGLSAIDDDTGATSQGRVKLYGADLTYRRYMNNNKRLLLRGEYFKYKPSGGVLTVNSNGYYGLANYRFTRFDDIGLLYEKSDFPQAPGQRENAASLIYTKQLTEQFYLRAMGTHGRRGGQSYNELRLQFTAGLGPHTHNLE